MLAFCRSSLKSKKYIIILLALAAIAGLGTHAAWSSNGLPRIDNKTLARLAQQHPVVVLFRHAERCDRSTNQCLSDKTGITVKEGANKQVISSQVDSLIKISRIWADFFPANTSNQPI